MEERSKSLVELFSERFNSKYRFVKDPSGEDRPFQIEKLIDSLFTLGLNFKQILSVLDLIEPGLEENIKTSDLKALVVKCLREIDIEQAEKFQRDYYHYREIIDHPSGGESLILNSESAKKIFREDAELKEFYFTTELEDKLAQALWVICKSRYTDKIQYYQIKNRVEDAIKKIFGRSLDEYIVEAKSIIEDVDSTLNTLGKQKKVHHDDVINVAADLSAPILIYFKVLPGLTPLKTIVLFRKLIFGIIDSFRFNILKIEFNKFFQSIKVDKFKNKIMEDVTVFDKLIDEFKEVFRKLLTLEIGKYTLLESETLNKPPVILNLKRLALFGKFLFPYTQNDLFIKNIRESVLRHLYRYPSVEIITLLKKVQVHPKYMDLVVKHLKNQKCINVHKVSNKTIILLTETGVKYCEEILGLRIKYSLPYV
jgi:hypothetical protein